MLVMVVTTEIGAKELRELIDEVQAGNEVLITKDHKPVARLLPAQGTQPKSRATLRVKSLTGHRVLATSISQAELADEMFGLK
jgi:prevent-host-death family protein